MNYLGLNSLFTSVLNTLNMAELGFGGAVVFFLYKALAEDDYDRVSALMNYYKKIYRVIGAIITVCGLALLPFLNVIIKSDVPEEINIYVLYLLSLCSTVSTYFLFAYKNCILDALQRKDVISNVNSILLIIERALQIFFIFVLKNYYLYVFVTTLTNIANNLVLACVVRKKYPQFEAKGELSKDVKKGINTKVRGLFMYKVGNVVLGSADNIVMSAFLGLTITGMFGNYYYIITTLFAFLGIYYNSIRAGIGNSIVTESVEKNLKDFKFLQFLQNWIVGWCTTCLFCIFQDFVTMYAGEEYLFDMSFVLCICVYFFVWKIQDVVHVFKEASGMWDKDKYRPLIGALINLIVNIVLVQFIGVYGILLSTIAVFVVIDLPWASQALFREYFGVKKAVYYRLLIEGTVCMVIMCATTYFVCSFINYGGVIGIAIKGAICCVVPNVIYVLLNIRKKEFQIFLSKMKTIIKK